MAARPDDRNKKQGIIPPDNAPLFCHPRHTNSETANSPTLVLFAQSALAKPTRAYASYPASSASGWHKTMGTADKFASYTYDGGSTWGEPYQFRGTDGKNGRPGSDANIPEWVEAYTRTATYIDDQWVIAPNIAGGSITALDRMEAACDFYVGNNIYLGYNNFSSKGIVFNNASRISVDEGIAGGLFISTPRLTLAADNAADSTLKLVTPLLDLSKVDKIDWGKNAPVAVFG